MLNRREMVMTAGASLAGLASLAPQQLVASVTGAGPSAALPPAGDILRQIRLQGPAEQTFLERLGREPTRSLQPLPELGGRTRQNVEGQVISKLDPQGRPFALGLRFLCHPAALNLLTVDGRAFTAKRFCFSVSEVAWRPGLGLPVYSAPCPRYEYGVGEPYRSAKSHQIVPVVLNQTYFTGCQTNDVCEAADAGPVAFDVNDSDYDDNEGYYVIDLWSWS